MQWTFQYPSASIKRLGVEDGAALTAAGKTAICAADAATYKCLTVGSAGKVIDEGSIAKVTAVLAPGATTTAIVIENALGTSLTGHLIPISSNVRLAGSGASGPSDCAQPKPKGQPGISSGTRDRRRTTATTRRPGAATRGPIPAARPTPVASGSRCFRAARLLQRARLPVHPAIRDRVLLDLVLGPRQRHQ